MIENLAYVRNIEVAVLADSVEEGIFDNVLLFMIAVPYEFGKFTL